jgi:hypothetical protein
MSKSTAPSFLSPRRILVIAQSTVTHLIRMKVFYFLAPIAVLFVGLQFFDGLWYAGPDTTLVEQELRMHKNICLGTMMLFGCLFAVVSTALLIPGDVEDRTLYTILCKPVPRMDYLLGKLLGVVFVILVAMAVMDLLMVATLHFRVEAKLAEITELLTDRGLPEREIESVRAEVAAHGSTLNLQYGVLAHFLKAAVIVAVALLISTFSTSTLFTIAVSVMVWIIGEFQWIVRDGLFNDAEYGELPTTADRIVGTIVSVVFPDFRLFGAIADGASRAETVIPSDVGQLCGLAGMYLGIYVVLSWFVFRDKEF